MNRVSLPLSLGHIGRALLHPTPKPPRRTSQSNKDTGKFAGSRRFGCQHGARAATRIRLDPKVVTWSTHKHKGDEMRQPCQVERIKTQSGSRLYDCYNVYGEQTSTH